MKGYYNDPEATAAVLRDGWLLTGDMARTDEDGFIHLVDRKKDVIITGGENIYPVQMEDFLHRHPDVKDVAVIGLPDERLGEIAAAIVQLKRGHHQHRGGHPRVLRRPPPLQAPAPHHLRRGAAQRHRQDRQARAADATIRWRAWCRPRRRTRTTCGRFALGPRGRDGALAAYELPLPHS